MKDVTRLSAEQKIAHFELKSLHNFQIEMKDASRFSLNAENLDIIVPSPHMPFSFLLCELCGPSGALLMALRKHTQRNIKTKF